MIVLERSWAFGQNLTRFDCFFYLFWLALIVHDRSKIEKITKNNIFFKSVRIEVNRLIILLPYTQRCDSFNERIENTCKVSTCGWCARKPVGSVSNQEELTTTGACQSKLVNSKPTMAASISPSPSTRSTSSTNSSINRLCVFLRVAVGPFSPPRSRCVRTFAFLTY